jgi:Na+-driven multidrug efflux pump
LVFREPIAAWFTEAPFVVALAAEFLVYFSIGLGFYVLYLAWFRALQAAGEMVSRFMISIGVASVGLLAGWWMATQSDTGATKM